MKAISIIDTARSIASDAVLNCRWKIHSDIPMTRGLGSSAAACGAGLAAGFLLKNGTIDDKTEMFQELSRREGHADNAAAAIFGGLQAGFQNAENAVGHLPLPFPQHLSVLALIPATELSTASAREVLPNQHSTEAVSNNLAAITCLIEGLHSGEIENISRGCQGPPTPALSITSSTRVRRRLARFRKRTATSWSMALRCRTYSRKFFELRRLDSRGPSFHFRCGASHVTSRNS